MESGVICASGKAGACRYIFKHVLGTFMLLYMFAINAFLFVSTLFAIKAF
jgi:hypothetical protein